MEAKKKTDLFDAESISLIFSNVEEILEFQDQLLRQMEGCVQLADPASSLIGSLFVENVSLLCPFDLFCCVLGSRDCGSNHTSFVFVDDLKFEKNYHENDQGCCFWDTSSDFSTTAGVCAHARLRVIVLYAFITHTTIFWLLPSP